MFDPPFINGDSIIHRFDPRFRLVTATAYCVVIALSSCWSALIAGLLVSCLLIYLARLPLDKIMLRLLLVNGLILFLWVFLPFSIPGNLLMTIGPFSITKEGIIFAAILTLRSNIILLALMALIATIPVFTLGRAMRLLYVPEKIVQLFYFTYRYLHVIHLEYNQMVKALKIRGFKPKTSIHTYKTYAYLVGMVLIRSYDRAERIQNAMLCRGFKGRFYDLNEFSLRPTDAVIMSLIFLASAIIALLHWI